MRTLQPYSAEKRSAFRHGRAVDVAELLGGLGARRRGLRADQLYHFPVEITGEAVLVEEQHRAIADEQIGRVFKRRRRVMQDAGGLIDVVAGIEGAVAHLKLA